MFDVEVPDRLPHELMNEVSDVLDPGGRLEGDSLRRK
jgi:hypothetical protein